MHTLPSLHRKSVHIMTYNNAFDCVLSADESGMLEYWQPAAPFEKPSNVWEMKSSTNLFDFKKAKAVPSSITTSPSGEQFVSYTCRCFSGITLTEVLSSQTSIAETDRLFRDAC